MKASVSYRIAAVLLLLFAIGHTLGFRQSDPSWGVDALLGSMRSIYFDVQEFKRTYWELFQAAGFSIGVFYLFSAILAWQFGGLPATTLALMRRTGWAFALCFAAITVVSWRYLLYSPHRFLVRDHFVFDCSGMAFSQAGLHASIATAGERLQDGALISGSGWKTGGDLGYNKRLPVPAFNPPWASNESQRNCEGACRP